MESAEEAERLTTAGLLADPSNEHESKCAVKSYSQKNYHIGDGTLYSVLIPHQSKGAGRTFRGSTPGRGRGRGRGCRSQSTEQLTRPLKFHHQALPVEYMQHYTRNHVHTESPTVQQQQQEQQQQERLQQRYTVAESMSTAFASSMTGVDCRVSQPVTRPGRRRGRPRGRGRGSRAIPGFIQEVHDSMNRRHNGILIEKASFHTESTSSRLPAVAAAAPSVPVASPADSEWHPFWRSIHTLLGVSLPSLLTAQTSGDAPRHANSLASSRLVDTDRQPQPDTDGDCTQVRVSSPQVRYVSGIVAPHTSQPINLCVRDKDDTELGVRPVATSRQRSRRKLATPRHLSQWRHHTTAHASHNGR